MKADYMPGHWPCWACESFAVPNYQRPCNDCQHPPEQTPEIDMCNYKEKWRPLRAENLASALENISFSVRLWTSDASLRLKLHTASALFYAREKGTDDNR